MAINRRFRRPFVRRPRMRTKWTAQVDSAFVVNASSTRTTTIVSPADYGSNTNMSPSGVTLVRFIAKMFFHFNGSGAGLESLFTLGIMVRDVDDTVTHQPDLVQDLIDERYLWTDVGMFQNANTANVTQLPGLHYEADIRQKVKLRDMAVDVVITNSTSSTTGLRGHCVYRALLAGDLD